MMHQKALVFKDVDTANEIMQTTSPVKQKALGRLVKSFDENEWAKHREKIVYDGNYAKFTQNKHLLNVLLDTKGKILVEASPVDTIWGIGLAEDCPYIEDESNWRGLNLLGKVLTQLREDLLKDSR